MAARPSRRLVVGGLTGLGGTGLGGCAVRSPALPDQNPVLPLARLRADAGLLTNITVCLRPFRPQGPRMDTEQVGDKLVVHNYGHGGSGWSLSWGAGTLAVQKAMAASPGDIAVLGCGALGLTTGLIAAQAGARVTIYASALLPQTRSARATGTWSPDSRIAMASDADPQFGAVWEQMARISWKACHGYLGLPGDPVEFNDRYFLSDTPFPAPDGAAGAGGFARYEHQIADMIPGYETLAAGALPFDVPHARRTSSLMFNIAAYGHTLLNDFYAAGGRTEIRTFRAPGELAQLKQKVVINCTGFGARSLWRDESLVPVRGQIGWLAPQPQVTYGLRYRGVQMLPRRDGIAVQEIGASAMEGYGNGDERADRAETGRAIAVMAGLYGRYRDGGTLHAARG